ncbi:MAG: potassium transporter Kup [Povalibacter sp.]
MAIAQTFHASAIKGESSRRRALTLGALGVVFGDIGTSPLYAFKQAFTPPYGVAVSEANVIGMLSLIFWTLIMTVTLKYVIVMLRADNQGEGGVLSLSTLVAGTIRNSRLWEPVTAIGILGAALFFGDGILTPAISVTSAVEGLAVLAPRFEHVIVPATIVILAVLFAVQRKGTERVGQVFGPVIVVWFATLALLGILQIVQAPHVLTSLNPWCAVRFFANNGWQGFVVLSAVFLVVTGGEALYADLGHFGRVPIRNGWLQLVLPALTLNYLGQGALVLQDPSAMRNPFYLLAPSWLLIPMIVLATAATIIASQAVISGVFSVTRQAMNLGYLPRLRVLHSSAASAGQIYVPAANWILFVGTTVLVLAFRSSAALAGAYGIAVSATMLLAGGLVAMLAYVRYPMRRWALMPLLFTISAVDLMYFASNAMRALDDGWVPLLVAVIVSLLMYTWRDGRKALNWAMSRRQMPLSEFVRVMKQRKPLRTLGTAVYLTNEASTIPAALAQHLRFHGVLHERVIILTFARLDQPRALPQERVIWEELTDGVYKLIARYGFMEQPDTVGALRLADRTGLIYEPETTCYVVGRTTPFVTEKKGMARWRKRLYVLMARNTRVGYEYFGVPEHRLLEVGSQVHL